MSSKFETMTIQQHHKSSVISKYTKVSMGVFAILLIGSGFYAYDKFTDIFSPNVSRTVTITIKSDDTFEEVYRLFKENELLHDVTSLKWVAHKKEYDKNIVAGRYRINEGENTNTVVNRLRVGDQAPVKVTFNNARTPSDLAGKVSKYFESDSLSFLEALIDAEVIASYGESIESFPQLFIPNTYEMYWTNTPEQFIERMKKEHSKFWNSNRMAKAREIGLTPLEVTVLASIVQEETIKADEYRRVSGVYMNRLKKGWMLQADPTVKFAVHDFTIKRVLNKHLEVDSPYNTYKYVGLPPGPIAYVNPKIIDAVLDYEQHRYFYFCAKDDFSGYHAFAKTLAQHNRNAQKYQRALNKNKIWK